MFERLQKHPAGNVIFVFLLAQIACISAALLFPDRFFYLTEANMAALLDAIPILGIIALGVAILMISSDMEEVLGISDRIAVMHEGKITGILDREKFSEENIMNLAVGRSS